MKKYELIDLVMKDDVGLLTFNRPEQLNAMNRRMMDEIIDALEVITGHKDMRATIITGRGKAFMAGADIKEYAVQSPEEFADFRKKGMQLYELIENAGIPFIAAVNGFALGGGFEIALSCDFIVAAETASMGLPEIKLNLIPGGGGTYRLFQKVGLNRVREVLLLGQPHTSQQMYEWGVVHKVTAEGGEMEYALQLAEKLKKRPAAALRALKKTLSPSGTEQSFSEQMFTEGQLLQELFYDDTAQNLIKGFLEKNK